MRAGDESPIGRKWRNPIAAKLLETATQESGYLQARRQVAGKKIGMGFSLCERGTGGGPCTARVTISEDGKLLINIS